MKVSFCFRGDEKAIEEFIREFIGDDVLSHDEATMNCNNNGCIVYYMPFRYIVFLREAIVRLWLEVHGLIHTEDYVHVEIYSNNTEFILKLMQYFEKHYQLFDLTVKGC